MVRVDVDPHAYSQASEPLVSAGEWVTRALGSLQDGLSGGGSMAGSDSGGQSFAGRYDEAAATTVRACSTLAASLGTMSNLVRTAAHNHDAADAGSTRRSHGAPAAPPSAYLPVAAFSPPSASGGTGDEPDWWHYVIDHIGSLVWPDADTGRLRSAASAWQAAAGSLDSMGGELQDAVSLLQVHDSPEVPRAVAAINRLDDFRTRLASQCRSLGDACTAYAQQVDDTHDRTSHIMEEVLAGLAITGVVGIGLTLVTFGGSDVAAAAAASAEVAGAAEEVAGVLETCAAAAEEGATAMGEVAAGAGEVESGLAPFEAAEPELAEVTAVDDGAAGSGDGAGPQQVFRADTRPPEDIFRDGFQPKGDNMDLDAHVRTNPPDSGYVSTTSSMQSAQDFAHEVGADYVYGADAEGIDVNATMGADSPFPWENEIAVPGGIEPTSIQGAWGPNGWLPNPGYVP